jgi:predicted RNase H-like HicB family nuclease
MSRLFQSVIYKEGKFFVAQCLDVDVSSFGDSENEAKDNLIEAIALYFENQPKLQINKVQAPKIVELNLGHA